MDHIGFDGLGAQPARQPEAIAACLVGNGDDARGIAQLMRLGWFRPVHCKSMPAQEVRALLTARKLVQSKLFDIEMACAAYCVVSA